MKPEKIARNDNIQQIFNKNTVGLAAKSVRIESRGGMYEACTTNTYFVALTATKVKHINGSRKS